MIKKITKNIGIKLFCVILASILWVYVAAGQDTIGKFPGSIKIKAINIPSGLEAIYDVDTVNIKIMADSSSWGKLSADSFSAFVDMAARSEGTYEVSVTVVCNQANVAIVEKNPDKIFVRLEPIITKEVSINKKIEGSAAEGLTAGGIKLDPEKAIARGPKSKIDNITEAFVSIKLNGESENFTKTLPLLALDSNGENVLGVEFTPSEVKAEVLITKASNNKTVGIRVVTSGAPKTGYFVSSVSVNPSTVDIIAPKSILSDINFVETTPFDLTNLSSDFEKDLSLNLNNGIVLQTGVLNKVRVKVKIVENEIQKEITATIVPKNLNNWTIVGYNNNQIKTIVSGPKSIIENIKSSDVSLILDFSEKQLSESVNFDLKNTNFIVQTNVSIISFLPSSIVVNLSKQ